MDGLYTMWLIAENEERADNVVGVFENLVGQYHRAIADRVGYDIDHSDSGSSSSSSSSASTGSESTDDDTGVFDI